MRIQKLLMITGNSGKAAEFRSLLNLKDIEIDHLSLNLEEIQSFDLKEIGVSQVKSAVKQMEPSIDADAILIDDTGLFCDGLNGLPGPFIKWFLDRLQVEGLYGLLSERDKATKAVCLLSLGLLKTNDIIHFEGIVDGQLVEPKGSGGFGWDRLFKPRGSDRTYGELTPEEKNTISHRTIAVQNLRRWITEKNDI